jgi:hypothetical protein
LKKTSHGRAVAITLHGSPIAVLLSYEEFESLVQARARHFENLGAEFDEFLEPKPMDSQIESPTTENDSLVEPILSH